MNGMSDEEAPRELDGGGYTRSGEAAAGWAGGSWTVIGGPAWVIRAFLSARGVAWPEEPVTVRNDGLKVAAGAITVRLS